MKWDDHQPGRDISRQYGIALEEAALAQNRASRIRKTADRVLDHLFLLESGTVDGKKAASRTHEKYVEADDLAIEAEATANLAKAKADALKVEWETWRTIMANERAEMKL